MLVARFNSTGGEIIKSEYYHFNRPLKVLNATEGGTQKHNNKVLLYSFKA